MRKRSDSERVPRVPPGVAVTAALISSNVREEGGGVLGPVKESDVAEVGGRSCGWKAEGEALSQSSRKEDIEREESESSGW